MISQVGNKGDKGVVEISDILFTVMGPVPGAILVEWNIADIDGQQATAGIWDSHFRIGGEFTTLYSDNIFQIFFKNKFG